MKKTLLALVLAAALPLSAHAQDKDLSYTWAEADYVELQGDASGWGVRGSYEFADTGFYVLGGYSWTDSDGGFFNNDDDEDLLGDVDIDSNELGVGYHYEIADSTDLIGELAYRNADADLFRVDGLRTTVGVNSALSDNFEGFLKANYYDFSDYDGDVTGTIGGQFKFSEMWGITGEAEFGSGDEAYMVGVRASF